MKTLIAILLLTASTLSVASEINCELRAGRKAINSRLSLSEISEDGITTENGLDVGENNFSFSMAVENDRADYTLSVFFYENNNVMDEVGDLTCDFKLKPGTNEVCREPIEYDGKKIATFICRTTK